jgi:hypothetical protein
MNGTERPRIVSLDLRESYARLTRPLVMAEGATRQPQRRRVAS